MKKKEMIIEVLKKIVSYLVRGEFDVLKKMEMLDPSTCEKYATALHNYLQGREVLSDPLRTASATQLEIYAAQPIRAHSAKVTSDDVFDVHCFSSCRFSST